MPKNRSIITVTGLAPLSFLLAEYPGRFAAILDNLFAIRSRGYRAYRDFGAAANGLC